MSALTNVASTAGLKLSIWAIRLAAKIVRAVGYRVWQSGDRYTVVGNVIVRCATRLRIRAYEWERRIK